MRSHSTEVHINSNFTYYVSSEISGLLLQIQIVGSVSFSVTEVREMFVLREEVCALWGDRKTTCYLSIRK